MPQRTRPGCPSGAPSYYSEDRAREIGRALRAARLAQHLDLASLAECTFTRVSDLEALEWGEFDRVAARLHLPVFLRVYGDHLRFDGEALARPQAASDGRLAPAPEPTPRERSGGFRRQAAAMAAASLLLGVAAAVVYYHAPHHPVAVEATAADPAPFGGAGRTDEARPAALASAPVPTPAAAPSEGEPPAGGAAAPEPATVSPAVAEQPAPEVVSARRAEPSSGGTGTPTAEPRGAEGSGEPAPDVAAVPGGGSPAPDGERADVTRPTAPAPADPGPIGASPDTIAAAANEPVSPEEPAPLAAPAPPAAAAEPPVVGADAGAGLPVPGPPPRPEAGWADDASPAAVVSTGVPEAANTAVPGGGGPPATGAAEPEPAPAARGSGPPVAQASHAPDGSREPPPEVAATPDGGSTAHEGDRAGAASPAGPTVADPGPVGPSPETTIGQAQGPAASSGGAPLGAREPRAVTAEPTSAPPARAGAVSPAGRFAVYFFSVRPSARVSREWWRLTQRYPDLAGLELRPTRPVAIPGEGTFYAVEAGAFATRAEAQAVCDRLRSRGQACKVLTP